MEETDKSCNRENKEVAMIKQFVDLKDQNVLEIGCGNGSISVLLAQNAHEYVAIDPDRQRISEAQSLTGNVDFRIGTGEALEFENASFHVVLFTLSLHHQNGRAALKEAYRVLTENGRLIILEPSIDGELQQFFNLFNDETDALKEALNAMEQSYFQIERDEVFSTIMTFNNKTELCSYPFDRTIIQPDDNDQILEKLKQLQGPASVFGPIHLHDKINIFLLQKKSL